MSSGVSDADRVDAMTSHRDHVAELARNYTAYKRRVRGVLSRRRRLKSPRSTRCVSDYSLRKMITENLNDTDDYNERRKELLSILDDIIEDRAYKLREGRIRDVAHEEQRTRDARAIGYLVRTELKVLDQMERSEIEERLDAIEQQERFEIPA